MRTPLPASGRGWGRGQIEQRSISYLRLDQNGWSFDRSFLEGYSRLRQPAFPLPKSTTAVNLSERLKLPMEKFHGLLQLATSTPMAT